MSSDLVAWAVAIGLGIAVVVLGLRRKLSETTRNGLPRLGGDTDRATATLGLYEGGDKRRRPLSPRQRQWAIGAYLLMSLTFAAFAVLSAQDRLFHAIFAVTLALNAAVYWLKRSPSSPVGPLPDPAPGLLAKRKHLIQAVDKQVRDLGIEVSSDARAPATVRCGGLSVGREGLTRGPGRAALRHDRAFIDDRVHRAEPIL
jgi:hypothetical protein